ncbi:hypothetical protein D8S78_16485 [Natrialba swarupiae]|nr:hypothetical protein [Natrialba swarupiae]
MVAPNASATSVSLSVSNSGMATPIAYQWIPTRTCLTCPTYDRTSSSSSHTTTPPATSGPQARGTL